MTTNEVVASGPAPLATCQEAAEEVTLSGANSIKTEERSPSPVEFCLPPTKLSLMKGEADVNGQQPQSLGIPLTVPYERKDFFRAKYGQQFFWLPEYNCWSWSSEKKLPRDLQFYIHPSFALQYDPSLRIELVPKRCWFRNLRHLLPYPEWRRVRRLILDAAGDKCEICRHNGDIECHEIFEYDDILQIQTLIGLQALCARCHKVRHFGMGQAKDTVDDLLAHLCRVNYWSIEAAERHMRKQIRLWKERSEMDWHMDFSFMKRHFKIVVRPESPTRQRKRLERIQQMKSPVPKAA